MSVQVEEHTAPAGWPLDNSLTVAAAIREAMENTAQRPRTRSRPSIETPRDLPAPEPHLPLRKASAHRLQARKGTVPRPLFLSQQQHQVEGFNPTSVQPLPRVDHFTASSEHAFAGKAVRRRPSKLPLGDVENLPVMRQYAQRSPSWMEDGAGGTRPPSSPLLPPPASPGFGDKMRVLSSSKSVGSGLRSLRRKQSNKSVHRDYSAPVTPEITSAPRSSGAAPEQGRESFMTSTSSFAHLSSIHTSRSSGTGNSSHSDFVKVLPEDWLQEEDDRMDIDMSVEDAIGMYEDGFDSARESLDTRRGKSASRKSMEIKSDESFEPPPLRRPQTQHETPKRPHVAHRRSQSASLLLGIAKSARPGASPTLSLAPPEAYASRPSLQINPSSSRSPSRPPVSAIPTEPTAVPRDRYGFKKASQYITVEQYDAWDATYSEHIARRSAKWHALMHSYGFATDQPFRFPPKSDKIKRYVRKGIPPEFRGAAWFWYAGGPGQLKADKGLYWALVEKVENGLLGDSDREHIERDLNRTFPDNIKFKPDPTAMGDAQAGAGGGSLPPPKDNPSTTAGAAEETPMVHSLRRVLQAFAIHNPNIGYCQSLNFIAGLLLLFLDQDEEKAFILLTIVTTQHLPGTHGVALEGANIDIAVLMSCIKDALPGIWSKLDDKKDQPPNSAGTGVGGALRLPTVSLATTAWFMSLFVGTLPIESVLRVWDCLFFEGSKTLFRIALAIFKFGEQPILDVSDPMEIFQVVQTIPRSLLDVNGLMEVCFRRRGGFGGVSQGLIEGRREERRREVKQASAGIVQAQEGVVKRLRGRLRKGTIIGRN